MKTIEQKAREYAISKTCTQYHCAKRHYITCENHGKGCDKAMGYYESFLAGAKAATEWISVHDELPQPMIDVIIQLEYGGFVRGRYWQQWWRADGAVIESSSTSYRAFEEDEPQPTHWRPIELPE